MTFQTSQSLGRLGRLGRLKCLFRVCETSQTLKRRLKRPKLWDVWNVFSYRRDLWAFSEQAQLVRLGLHWQAHAEVDGSTMLVWPAPMQKTDGCKMWPLQCMPGIIQGLLLLWLPIRLFEWSQFHGSVRGSSKMLGRYFKGDIEAWGKCFEV